MVINAKHATALVPLPIGTVLSTILGLVVTAIVLSAATKGSLPLISSGVVGFWAVAVLGVTMCTLAGVGQAPAALGWLHPYTLTGIVLGVLAMVLMAMVLFGRTEPLVSAATTVGLGAISGASVATIGLGSVILVKWLLGFALYRLK
jgi:hypothetical protein